MFASDAEELSSYLNQTQDAVNVETNTNRQQDNLNFFLIENEQESGPENNLEVKILLFIFSVIFHSQIFIII
jgi:hypothetical protein